MRLGITISSTLSRSRCRCLSTASKRARRVETFWTRNAVRTTTTHHTPRICRHLAQIAHYSLLALLFSACVLLPENAAMVDAALAALPSLDSPAAAASPAPVAGQVAALDFVCALWSFLHHQLQLLGAERDASDKQREEAAAAARPPTAATAAAAPTVAEFSESKTMDTSAPAMDLSIEHAATSDPFAAFAARRAAASATSDAPASTDPALSSIDTQMDQAANATNEEYEEKVSGAAVTANARRGMLGSTRTHLLFCCCLSSAGSRLPHSWFHELAAAGFLCHLLCRSPCSPAVLSAPSLLRAAPTPYPRVPHLAE